MAISAASAGAASWIGIAAALGIRDVALHGRARAAVRSSDPRRPFLIVSPKRSVDVGSPTMQASIVSPRACSVATTAAVPSTASPSSSDVSRIAIEPRSIGSRATTRSAAVTIAATDAFMSAAPRPYRRPSRSVGVNGSLVHSLDRTGRHDVDVAGEADERSRRCRDGPTGCAPRRDRSARTRSPPPTAAPPAGSRQPPSSGVIERHAMSCLARCSVSALDVGHARSSSLMDVLARVCASTRFTMTAQASEYLPSADGRLPGTTTDPDGTRP